VTTGDGQWIFGYGSLVWRPAFEHLERRAGFVEGFARRFWQGSTDHRGVPEAPGRVATLVREQGAVCWGMAYRVAAASLAEVLRGLDHRESGGFDRVDLPVHFGRAEAAVPAISYVALPGNPNYLGPATLGDIAAQVRLSTGPSGSNVEYVVRLADALCEMRAEDDHVFALADLVGEGQGWVRRAASLA
jgi:cation transport regulator ChaC